ncbi:ornithine carbamoyltransferase [Streptomyces lunaelactis]|uniref:ornithine carbamoyltransferase n=1 Tax=Streptomyces lunaelactis TaxID=1535768 RepID=UPI001584E117|nr:ornithine carbamoyltransferase [Streptomyces lunaelactis]NUL32359.1 ornithine carbamoyltransferase [Streptomyces lunaelactis]
MRESSESQASVSRSSVRHFISLDDLTDEELHAVAERGAEFADRAAGAERPLDGCVAGIYFAKTSTRTRTAFSAGAQRLGASIVAYGPGDLQTNTGETSEDTGRVFSRMLDVLVARTAGPQAEMRAWARQDRMSVINAMSAEEHPTQAIADLVTLLGQFGRVKGLRVLYLGEGNNTAVALALALSRYPGVELELRTPRGYGLAADVLESASKHAARCGASVRESHDLDDLPRDVDAIYTTRWQTTGTTKPDADWRERVAPFQVGARLWETSPDAVFLHDLPAHRGDEVTAEVLDGPRSIAFAQAENKMHSAMAVLEWCRGGVA